MNYKVLTFHGGGSVFLSAVAKCIVLHSADAVIVPTGDDIALLQEELARRPGVKKEIGLYAFSDIVGGVSDATRRDEHKRLLLFMQFIEEWNCTRGTNYPLEFAEELCFLFDELCLNCVDFEKLCLLLEDEKLSEQCKITPEFLGYFVEWLKLCNVEVVKPSGSIDEVDGFLKNLRKASCRKVVVAGVAFNNLFLCFLKSLLRDIPESVIILPCLDLSIPESQWQVLDERHHQHYFMKLLRYIGATREEVCEIDGSKRNDVIDLLFNFEIPATPESTCHVRDGKTGGSGIKLITCKSESEEVMRIIEILHSCCDTHQEHTDRNTSDGRHIPYCREEKKCHSDDIWKCVVSNKEPGVVFVESDSLALRIRSVLSLKDAEVEKHDIRYVVSSLALCVIDVVLSGGDSTSLLALLKHPLVMLGYKAEEYFKLVSEFEIDIVRKKAASGFEIIDNTIDKTTPELLCFWQSVTNPLNILRTTSRGRYSISEIQLAHMSCIDGLIGENSELEAHSMREEACCEIRKFFSMLRTYCTGAKVFSLQSYYIVCSVFLEGNYCLERNRLSSVSFIRGDTVVISGFNEGESLKLKGSSLLGNVLRRRLELPTAEEYEGYLLCALYSLFHVNTLYVTRSIECCGKATEAPILVRYLDVLLEYFSDVPERKTDETQNVFTDTQAVNICIPNPDLSFRSKVLSSLTADAVGMLITNPYAFYARYVLGIIPVREVNTEHIAYNFSNLVHRILLQYLKKVGLETDKSVLIDIAKKEFSVVSKNYPYVEKLWWPRFEKIAESFYRTDKERKLNISSIMVEESFSWKVRERITVLSKCDTATFLQDGSVSIVRYKVGAVPSQVDIRCGFSPRGIVESLCVAECMNAKKVHFAYWKVAPESVEVTEIRDFDAIAYAAKEDIENLLIKYLDEMTPFYVRDDFSKFSEYELLSRVREYA